MSTWRTDLLFRLAGLKERSVAYDASRSWIAIALSRNMGVILIATSSRSKRSMFRSLEQQFKPMITPPGFRLEP